MLLQKFPKQLLYFPRCLLMTVAKCAPEISETLFIKVVFIKFFIKDGQIILLRKFPKQLLQLKVVPSGE